MKANWLYLILSVLLLTLLAAACGPSLTDSEKRRLDSLTYDIEQYPTDSVLYQRRGEYYLRLCMLEDALEDYTMAIQLSDDGTSGSLSSRARSYEKRAVAYILLGRNFEALQEQERALRVRSEVSYLSLDMLRRGSAPLFDAAKKRAELDPC